MECTKPVADGPVLLAVDNAETARHVPEARTEPLGRVELKGKAEPVEAYRLVEFDTPGG